MDRRKRFWIALFVLVLAGVSAPAQPARGQEGVCDNAPQPRLSIGGWAVVTDVVTGTAAGGLRTRDQPRTTATEIALLPAGALVRVLDGPACNDGFRWWYLYIVQDDLEGWSAEGWADQYYLAPAAAPPPTPPGGAALPTLSPVPVIIPANLTPLAPTPIAAPGMATGNECPDDPAPSYLRPGAAARVADQTRPIRLRPEPAVSSIIMRLVYQDAVVMISGNNVCADGYRWWPVDIGGQPGWTVEAANGRYLLIDPANPPPSVNFAGGLSPIPPSPEPLPLPPGATAFPTPRPTAAPAVPRHVAYTPDGARLVVGSGDGLRLYDAATLAPQGSLAVGPVIDLVLLDGALHAVAWAPEGIRLVDAVTGAIRTVLTRAPYDPAWAAAAPDGQWLILGPTSDGATATLWNLNSAAPPEIAPYWWPGWGVVSASFSPDSASVLINDIVYLRSCQMMGAACQFDLIRMDFIASGFFGDTDWSGDGAVMGGFSDRFWQWDGNPLGIGLTVRTTLDPSDPRRVALNHDGTRGAVASRRLMELWNLQPGAYNVDRVVELPDMVGDLAFRPAPAEPPILAAVVGTSVLLYDGVSGAAIAQVE